MEFGSYTQNLRESGQASKLWGLVHGLKSSMGLPDENTRWQSFEGPAHVNYEMISIEGPMKDRQELSEKWQRALCVWQYFEYQVLGNMLFFF